MVQSTQLICFNCANLFSYEGGSNIVCPECAFSINRKVYNRLINYASEAAEYGYLYRQTYEKDFHKGKLNSRYQISFDEIWIFAALAALSGVIGNATYDLIKIAINKIRRKRAEFTKASIFVSASRVLGNEEQFKLFLRYIEEFHKQGLKGLPDEVAIAILEEMFVDETVKLLPRGSDGEHRVASKEELIEIHRQALVNVASKKKPKKKDFEKFWEEMENSDVSKREAERSKIEFREKTSKKRQKAKRQSKNRQGL